MKKVFILTQFGKPHEWTQQFIDEVQFLEKYGWYWKIFTPNQFASKGNVEVINMDIDGFNALCVSRIGINPEVGVTSRGLPSKPMSDFYIASGRIFGEYIKGFDYWGITNWDIVYGRLDKFLPDEELRKWEVWSDDVNTVNGIFCLFRNDSKMNYYFTELDNWDKMMMAPELYGTDEYGLTDVVRQAALGKKIDFGYPKPYPMHSHDRLEQHIPNVKLERHEDGSLFELFEDVNGPHWLHERPFIGREIPYFHFIRTKEFPKL